MERRLGSLLTAVCLGGLCLGAMAGCDRGHTSSAPAPSATPAQPSASSTAPTPSPSAQAPPPTANSPALRAPETHPITLGGRIFQLELALTPQARFQGLSDRMEIPEDGGMIFVFPETRSLTFVMRRCLVPIDVIFVDDQYTVTAVHAMQVEPYDRMEFLLKRYSSGKPARIAIELQGGMARVLGIQAGQRLDLDLAGLKARTQ